MLDLSLELILLLLAVAFVAGVIDSIAGGSGLVVIPALLLAGLPPADALGTNKLQGLFGTGSATLAYARAGHVDFAGQWRWALLGGGASLLGAWLATVLPSDLLGLVLPFLLVAIALYFALKPDLGDVDRARRIGPVAFGAAIAPLVGLYDGLFGPGTGSFFMLALVTLAGYGLLKATAHTKLLNFATNVGAFVGFAMAGAVWWKLGLMMGVAQFLGARLGAVLAMRTGARLIRPLLVVVSSAMALRLLLDSQNPLRLWLGW